MPTIRIDDEVYAWLQKSACPFEDTPNSVLRRIAKLDEVKKMEKQLNRQNVTSATARDAQKTPQYAFRDLF